MAIGGHQSSGILTAVSCRCQDSRIARAVHRPRRERGMSDDLHVIFGTGPVGSWIAAALTARGERVRAVNRSGKSTDLMPASVRSSRRTQATRRRPLQPPMVRPSCIRRSIPRITSGASCFPVCRRARLPQQRRPAPATFRSTTSTCTVWPTALSPRTPPSRLPAERASCGPAWRPTSSQPTTPATSGRDPALERLLRPRSHPVGLWRTNLRTADGGQRRRSDRQRRPAALVRLRRGCGSRSRDARQPATTRTAVSGSRRMPQHRRSAR